MGLGKDQDVVEGLDASPRPPVLEARDLRKVYRRPGKPDVVAVDGVSLAVRQGQCLGLVGESGSGKSTVASMVLRLLDVTSGQVVFAGEDITHASPRRLRQAWRGMQAIFQDPAGSFDPRRTLGHGIAEGMRNAGMSRRNATERTAELLERCGLDPTIARRHPREVSGGQCQRAAIARAIALRPKLLVCDEPTSALDVTVQRQVIELLEGLREEEGMSMLFISHDLALVSQTCDAVAVMQAGRIVESGPTRQVVERPTSDYTRALIDAIL